MKKGNPIVGSIMAIIAIIAVATAIIIFILDRVQKKDEQKETPIENVSYRTV